MKRMTIAMLAAMLLAAIVLPAAAATSRSATAVTGHVATRAYVTTTDSGILVKANCGWSVIVETADGSETYIGKNTSGTEISLPDDTVTFWMTTE